MLLVVNISVDSLYKVWCVFFVVTVALYRKSLERYLVLSLVCTGMDY